MSHYLKLFIAVYPFAVVTTALAFETKTHNSISKVAAHLAITDEAMLRVGRLPAQFKQTMPTSSEPDIDDDLITADPQCLHKVKLSAIDLIACGAMFEDHYDLLRSLNHFLDGQHYDEAGLGISIFGGFPPTVDIHDRMVKAFSAAEWALQDHPAEWHGGTQIYNYRNAEDYLWRALTYREGRNHAESLDVRERSWGLLFQSLGQVVHLLEDMGSPQHTRSELHYDKFDVGNVSQISRYEKRALKDDVASWIGACILGGASDARCARSQPVKIAPMYPTFASRFRTPRSFWESDDQTGLAQVASRSFPTNLRNFRALSPGQYAAPNDYPLPMPAGTMDISIDQLADPMTGGIPPFVAANCGANGELCRMRMIGASLSDPLGQGVMFNERASSESLFDQDLLNFNIAAQAYDPMTGAVVFTKTYATPTINQFNIDRAYELLIPRSVGYAAGFLNFYFRGAIAIKPPPGGIYAIADESAFSAEHPADIANGYRGFDTLRASLANATSYSDSSPPQPMTDGKLWAILRFRRNDCYSDDFDDLATTAQPLSSCIDPAEEIVVSEPIDRTGVGREVLPLARDAQDPGETLTFTFRDQLPINAWNVLLQIVFRGTLGSETNKIVVSTVDLSEPTFFSAFNNTDFVYMSGRCYTVQDIAASPDLWQRVNPTCKYPDDPRDILSGACYKAKFGFRLKEADTANPHFQIVTEIESDKDQRVPPGRFSRFAILLDPGKDARLALAFRNPGLVVDAKSREIAVKPYRAHYSRTSPGEEAHDNYSISRGIKTWYGFAYMVDIEQASIVVDSSSNCILGQESELPTLSGINRYPTPSTIVINSEN
jgi:hypothetical protein